MSLLDTASLLLTPNAYKEGKLYSVIPSDGSGDMSVTRATTATRVNSAGLVELVPYNLLRYSQDFSNAGWDKTSGGTGSLPVVTANNAIAPDGTLTADTIVFNAGAGTTASDQSQMYQTISLPVGTFTGSFYARVTSGTGQLMFRHAAGGSYTTANITTTWQRFSSVETTAGGTQYFELAIRRGLNEPMNASVTVELWGAQLVEGSVAKDYQKTETRLNIPRLDYSNGTCPSLLVEPQRTNLALYSQQFDNAYWSKFNCTITANNAVAPDGTNSADRLVLTSISPNAQTLSRQSPIVTTTTTVTFSTFVKYVDKQYIQLVFSGGFSSQFANFDLINGIVTNGTYVSANVQSYANGWYRISITTTGLNTSCLPFIWAIDTALALRASDSTSTGTSAYLIWGAQVEDGSYATSYIPTTSASVTRNADSVSKTGISSLIGQQEGTVFIDVVINGCDNPFANLVNTEKNTNASFGIAYLKGSSQISAFVNYGGSYIGISGASIAIGQRAKIAFAYKSGNTTLYVNGVQIATDATTFTIPASLDDIFIGDPVTYFAYQESITNNATALWKTRLTNDQLAQLTTI